MLFSLEHSLGKVAKLITSIQNNHQHITAGHKYLMWDVLLYMCCFYKIMNTAVSVNGLAE